MTKTFPEVISGIRTAKKGVEVREDIAQMGEYVEQFAQTAAEKAAAAAASEEKASAAVKNIDQQTEDAVTAINTAESKALTDVETARTGALTDIGTARAGVLEDIETARSGAVQDVTDTKAAALTALDTARQSTLQEMQASADAAAGSAEKAAASEGNAGKSERAAASCASAAATSETNSSASEAAAKESADSAAASAELAGTRASTDKTLTIEDAPADAKKTGEELALRYTKEQMDALLAQYKADTLLAAYPVGSLYMSADATSPAELFGGTWEQIKDRFILAAGDTYAAGSMGGSSTHSHAHALVMPIYTIGSGAETSIVIPSFTGCPSWTGMWREGYLTEAELKDNVSYTRGVGILGDIKNSTSLPPYITKYVWQRIE